MGELLPSSFHQGTREETERKVQWYQTRNRYFWLQPNTDVLKSVEKGNLYGMRRSMRKGVSLIYRSPHSRRCNCRRMSWIALKTTKNIFEWKVARRKKKLHTFDLLCVRGTRIMGVDLFRHRALVKTDKSVQKVVTSGIVVAATSVIWKVILERWTGQLLSEQVDLIQE